MISFQNDWYFFMQRENATCKDDWKQINVMIMAAWGSRDVWIMNVLCMMKM